jgi:DoxX-like family
MSIASNLAILLAAALAWAGCLNLVGPDFIRAEFKAWGYSNRLRLLVGALEWTAAIALLIQPLRLIGCVIALGVLLGVLVTLFRQREYLRLEYPLVLLVLVLVVAITLIQGPA